ncbi:MAG: hypothetical protein IH788_03645 [Nitrospinae bacterium]|nr:hypothetical protein [Nitrospinota bacterium]
MKEKNRVIVLLAIGALLLATGCAGREFTTTEKTTLGGAALGAGAGALIGSASGHAGTGALIGTGIGALSGALLGQAIESEAAKQRRLSEQERYRQQQLGTYGGGTYGSGTYGGTSSPTLRGSQVSREQQLQMERERQRQRSLEEELARQREQQRRLEQELASLRAQRQGTSASPPLTSPELSTRIAALSRFEKQERLKVVEREIRDKKEEFDLARRIENVNLQGLLEREIRDLEEERGELERQLGLTRW